MAKDLLTQEETNELILKAQAGDSFARDTLVLKNEGLVSSVAKRYNVSNLLDFQDLQQEGYFGLIKAIEKFQPNKGFKFSTYATWWIRQSIQRAVSDNNRLIRIPVHIQEDLQRINKAKKILEQELSKEPTIADIYEKIKVDISWYDKIVEHEFFDVLVAMASEDVDVNSTDITDIEGVIMEDLGFPEDAEFICKKIVKFVNKNKSIPDRKTIANKVNLSKDKIKEILSYDNNIASLDQKVNDDSDNSFGDMIASEGRVEDEMNRRLLEEGLRRAIDEVYGNEIPEILEKIATFETQITYLKTKMKSKEIVIDDEIKLIQNSALDEKQKEAIKSFLKNLSNRKKASRVSINVEEEVEAILKQKKTQENKCHVPKDELLKRRFGICGYEKETLEQLGNRYNLSRERIRQIEKKILTDNGAKNRELKNKIIEYCNLDKDSLF